MAGKKRIKKVIKKRNNENAKKDISSRILLIIFLILCVVVFVLATIMITENAKSKNNKYDIRVPLTKEEISDGIDIKINPRSNKITFNVKAVIPKKSPITQIAKIIKDNESDKHPILIFVNGKHRKNKFT